MIRIKPPTYFGSDLGNRFGEPVGPNPHKDSKTLCEGVGFTMGLPFQTWLVPFTKFFWLWVPLCSHQPMKG